MKSAEQFCRDAGSYKPPANPIVKRLAKSLAATYNIAQRDDSLVMILGKGTESNNLQAIEYWVLNTLQNPDETIALDVLTHMVFRFGETLEQLEVSRWS